MTNGTDHSKMNRRSEKKRLMNNGAIPQYLSPAVIINNNESESQFASESGRESVSSSDQVSIRSIGLTSNFQEYPIGTKNSRMPEWFIHLNTPNFKIGL